ncbi:adenosine receptor A2b-like [Oculina patagonica]
MSNSEDLALISLFSILEIICLTFNVLVCVVLYRSKSLRIPMNNLIFNLAISDILIGLFIFPRHVIFSKPAFQHPRDITGDYFCKFITGSGILWTSSTASGFLLIAIAVERYTSIMIQHRSSPLTTSRINGIVAFCWVSAFLANLPTLIVFAYDEDSDFCIEIWPSWVSPKAYVMCIFFSGISSVIVMYVLYSQVIYTLWNRQRRATEISQAARLRARKNITKLLVLVTFIHTICRLPNYTTYLMVYYAPTVSYGSNTYNFTVLFILLNSTLHPFMLCWNMQGFRRPLFVLFCCCHANRVFAEPEPSHVSTNEARLSVFQLHAKDQTRPRTT